MIDFKKEIAEEIAKAIDIDVNECKLEIPKDKKQGDYAFPCFGLAKILKKSPQAIAEEINSKISIDPNLIQKTEIVSGYLNFFINKVTLAKTVVEEIRKRKEDYREK